MFKCVFLLTVFSSPGPCHASLTSCSWFVEVTGCTSFFINHGWRLKTVQNKHLQVKHMIIRGKMDSFYSKLCFMIWQVFKKDKKISLKMTVTLEWIPEKRSQKGKTTLQPWTVERERQEKHWKTWLEERTDAADKNNMEQLNLHLCLEQHKLY